MPNIFICGFGDEAEGLKRFVDDIMLDLGLQDDAITSIIETRPESCDGNRKSTPYIWVRSTKAGEIFLIIDALKEKGLRRDVEWDIIGGFIPAKKMEPIVKESPKPEPTSWKE